MRVFLTARKCPCLRRDLVPADLDGEIARTFDAQGGLSPPIELGLAKKPGLKFAQRPAAADHIAAREHQVNVRGAQRGTGAGITLFNRACLTKAQALDSGTVVRREGSDPEEVLSFLGCFHDSRVFRNLGRNSSGKCDTAPRRVVPLPPSVASWAARGSGSRRNTFTFSMLMVRWRPKGRLRGMWHEPTAPGTRGYAPGDVSRRPMRPAMTTAKAITRAAVTGSRKKTTPRAAAPTAPSPVHAA